VGVLKNVCGPDMGSPSLIQMQRDLGGHKPPPAPPPPRLLLPPKGGNQQFGRRPLEDAVTSFLPTKTAKELEEGGGRGEHRERKRK
jgi:hypothetical protein